MTTEKLTDDMMQSVQSEQTGANNDAPMEQSSKKPVKQKKLKTKRKYKTSTTLYILLTIFGVVLIGLGGAISVFELGEYKMANYRALPADPDLPPIEMQTTTLEANYEKGAQFKLDSTDWFVESYDIQYDNNLKDKVIIDVTAPKELYDVYLITQGENHYYLNCSVDAFNAFYRTLDLAKENYILEDIPPVTLKLTMSEAQAKNFKLNEERYKDQEARQSYNEQLNTVLTEYNEQLDAARNEYNERLTERQNEYDEQLTNLRTQYDEQIANMQNEHTQQIQNMQNEHNTRIEELQQNFNNQQEEQRDQYERRIAELEMQLNDARNALN
ncbi:MAG: hypothetical protein IJ936_00575 [Peptococcaceae bacterium]|nr:hypothetical protein [Peptococcaceae bacterium]